MRLLGGAMLSALVVLAVVSKQDFLRWNHRLSSEQSVESKNHYNNKSKESKTTSSSFPMNGYYECSSSWGVFMQNETILTETQFIRRTTPPPPIIESAPWIKNLLEDLFIDPVNNFAFCAIAKNAVSQWKTVLRNVYENRTTAPGFDRPDYKLHRASQEKHGVKQAKQILESPDSTVAIMVRDPLARFVSGYLGKCFSDNCANAHCHARRADEKGTVIPFRQALDWILSPKVNVANMDRHWKLQSARCGIQDGSLDYYFTIIGKMTKETLAKDADCVMKHAGLERFNIPATHTNDTFATFWNAGGAPKTHYRKEKEEDVLRKLFTPESARQLMKKFKEDYDIFQLPEPEWISHATGEWMDSIDHHECRNKPKPSS